MSEKLMDGQPCKHPGCLSHLSHPCEGCERIGGKAPFDYGAAHRRIAEKLGEDGTGDYVCTLAPHQNCLRVHQADAPETCLGCTYNQAKHPDYAHDPAATLRLMEYLTMNGIAVFIYPGIVLDVITSDTKYHGASEESIGEALVQAYDQVLEKEGK